MIRIRLACQAGQKSKPCNEQNNELFSGQAAIVVATLALAIGGGLFVGRVDCALCAMVATGESSIH